jgi:hypothetical protein
MIIWVCHFLCRPLGALILRHPTFIAWTVQCTLMYWAADQEMAAYPLGRTGILLYVFAAWQDD